MNLKQAGLEEVLRGDQAQCSGQQYNVYHSFLDSYQFKFFNRVQSWYLRTPKPILKRRWLLLLFVTWIENLEDQIKGLR
jgi:hypothetical protein